MIGRKFNNLTVISRDKDYPKSKGRKFFCRCVCGRVKSYLCQNLLQHPPLSCGCIQKSRIKLRPFESTFNRLRADAKTRKIECNLTYEEFINFTNSQLCHYCGSLIKWSAFRRDQNDRITTNLDRKNSSLGYSKDNLVVCCSRCNLGKGDRFSYSEWWIMGRALFHSKLQKVLDFQFSKQHIQCGKPIPSL